MEKEGFEKGAKMNKNLFRKRFFVFLLLGIFLVLVFAGGIDELINSKSLALESYDGTSLIYN